MEQLPSSIEAYLEEAGFSGVEIQILKKLLEEDALTLRELAAKTGKSTGALDQAMKKLLKKEIVTREIINDTPKYILHSLAAVSEWMKQDMQQKQQMIVRKYENFEAFLASLQKNKSRPEMEYFEGLEGLKQAYMQLLNRGKVMLRYGPTPWTEDEDPLRDFRVQFFRERKKRGVFSRVITHDTPLGRKSQSRDAFEYRQTLLVDQFQYPFKFERIVIGDTVACFQLDEQRACFIRYPELAEEERVFFERLWHEKMAELHAERQETSNAPPPIITVEAIPLKTKVLSQLRDFFLSRKSLAVFAGLAVLAAGISFGLYKSDQAVNFQRMQDKVVAIATTGALQIDIRDLEQLQQEEDYKKPEWAKVVNQLKDIRIHNTDIKYVYIFRKSKTDPHGLEFVADSHSLNPFANMDNDPTNDVDLNGDGKIDGSPTGADYLAWPGQQYPTALLPIAAFTSFNGVAASNFYEDQWGKVMTGYAPLKDITGKTVAVLAVDMNAAKLDELTNKSFTPIYWFIGLLLVFIIIRLYAFNRSLFKELWKIFNIRQMIVAVEFGLFVSLLLTFGISYYTNALNIKRIQDKVSSIAATGAVQFDARNLDQLHKLSDAKKPEYAKVVAKLNVIRNQNKDIKYAYILRPTAQNDIFEFIADADSLDPFAQKDINGDGIIDDSDALNFPGEAYDVQQGGAFQIAAKGVATADPYPYSDQWGTFISGAAPIRNTSGNVVAIFGVDMYANEVSTLSNQTFAPLKYFIIIFIISTIVGLGLFHKEFFIIFRSKRFVLNTVFALGLSSIVAYGLYYYAQVLNFQRMQKEVEAVAEAAAPQFNPDDINALQVEDDWEKPEWAKVVNQLQKIKQNNSDLVYVYIFRKTKNDPAKMEFVSDAGSMNPFANTDSDPTNDVDANGDGIIDASGADLLQWPGQPYPNPPKETFIAYDHSTYSDFYQDSWGKVVSGYAPIKDKNGRTIAAVAADMKANELNKLNSHIITPIIIFYFISILTFTISYFYKNH